MKISNSAPSGQVPATGARATDQTHVPNASDSPAQRAQALETALVSDERTAPDDDSEDASPVPYCGRVLIRCRDVPPPDWRARLRACGFFDFVGDKKAWMTRASAASLRLARAARFEPWVRECLTLS